MRLLKSLALTITVAVAVLAGSPAVSTAAPPDGITASFTDTCAGTDVTLTNSKDEAQRVKVFYGPGSMEPTPYAYDVAARSSRTEFFDSYGVGLVVYIDEADEHHWQRPAGC